MDSFRYCQTPDKVSKEELINALHQAYLQLKALDKNVDCAPYENGPALKRAEMTLAQAGHVGFAGLNTIQS